MLRLLVVPMSLLLSAGLAQAKMEIVGVEFSEGIYGPKRANAEFTAMSELYVRYRATGLKTDAEGRYDVTLGIAIRNPAGIPVDSGGTLDGKGSGDWLAGQWAKTIPAFIAPGKYIVRLTVRDNRTAEEAVAEREVTLKPLDLSVESPRLFFDTELKVPGTNHLVQNQPFVATCRLLGYDCTQGRCHVTLTWRLLDAKGQVIRVLHEDVYKEDDARVAGSQPPARGYWRAVAIENVGSFFIEVAAHDFMTNKTASLRVPVTVREP
jgi:hypothetical protein